jgi:hypothetical protein
MISVILISFQPFLSLLLLLCTFGISLFVKVKYQGEISGSHGGENEDDSLLGYIAVYFSQTTRRYVPEGYHIRKISN